MSSSPISSASATDLAAAAISDAARPAGRWRAIWAHARIARPPDTVLAFVGTLVGYMLAGLGHPLSRAAWVVGASNALLSAASMMINDWRDFEADRVNCPHRPIPSGDVPRGRALAMAVLAFTAGILLAGLVGYGMAARAALVAALSVAYTLRFKRLPLAGNVLTAALSSYTLWCWAFTSTPPPSLYWFVVATYFVGTIGKELARTAADAPGDRLAGIRTVATMIGPRGANRVGAALVGLAVLVAWMPVLRFPQWTAYAASVVISTLIGLAGGWLVRRAGRERETSRAIVLIARTITLLIIAALVWDLRGVL